MSIGSSGGAAASAPHPAFRGVEMRTKLQAADAFVLFGITGDLAFKMLFPALYAMEARYELPGPVIGVARSDLDTEGLHQRARDSLAAAKVDIDAKVFDRLCRRMTLTAGSFDDEETFRR